MRYHNITKADMLNGEGLRVVLWVSGCSHHCPGCQNAVTWDPEDGLEFDDAAKEEIFAELKQDWCSGITFSGGDPLFLGNRREIAELVSEIREKFPDKTIWIWSGFLFENVCNKDIFKYIDVLVDGQYQDELHDPTLKWCGSKNQRVIDVQKTLKDGKIELWEENNAS